MIITASKLDLSRITDTMIGRAHKVFEHDGTPFYLVESSEFESNGVEYKVTWSKEKGFQCNCASGTEGFRNCGKKKVCDHVLISLAAAREEKKAMEELNAKAALNTLYALHQRGDTRKVAAIKARAKALVAAGMELSEEDMKRFGLDEYK